MQSFQHTSCPDFLFGTNATPRMVGLGTGAFGQLLLYFREKDEQGQEYIRTEVDSFRPFAWVRDLDLVDGCPDPYRVQRLQGEGDFKFLLRCPSFSVLQDVLRYIRSRCGLSLGDVHCPYFTLNDDIQQFLMSSGRTLFRGMALNDLHRLQLDIETDYDQAFEFPNAERETDKILAISLSDNRGWSRVLHAGELDEPTLIQTFEALILERNPDTIEGHNIFRFDLPYLQARAARYGLTLNLGRDGSPIRDSDSTFTIGERQLSYTRRSIFGRHVIDTMLLSQLYHFDFHPLESFGLKDLSRAFGLASDSRTYIPGDQLRLIWRTDPARFLRYALDDVLETRAVAEVLLQPYFWETQCVPMQLQQVTSRPYGVKLEAVLARAYLSKGHAFPACGGGNTPPHESLPDQRFGLFGPVMFLDSRPLTTRLMLSRGTFPVRDHLGVLYPLVRWLNEAQQALRPSHETPPTRLPTACPSREREWLGRLEAATFEYLRLSMSHCADPVLTQTLVLNTREALRLIKRSLESLGARLLFTTQGMLCVELPTRANRFEDAVTLLSQLNDQLPRQAWLPLEGYYPGLLSFKAGNYALLTLEGRALIEGTLLRSKQLEPCLKRYADTLLPLVLAQRWSELPALVKSYQDGIQVWPLSEFLRRETVREPLELYQSLSRIGKRPLSPGYEAALRSGRPYLPGDQLTWYVGGTGIDQPEHATAQLGQCFDPEAPNLNRAWYHWRLQEIYQRFEGMVQKVGGPSWEKIRWQIRSGMT